MGFSFEGYDLEGPPAYLPIPVEPSFPVYGASRFGLRRWLSFWDFAESSFPADGVYKEDNPLRRVNVRQAAAETSGPWIDIGTTRRLPSYQGMAGEEFGREATSLENSALEVVVGLKSAGRLQSGQVKDYLPLRSWDPCSLRVLRGDSEHRVSAFCLADGDFCGAVAELSEVFIGLTSFRLSLNQVVLTPLTTVLITN